MNKALLISSVICLALLAYAPLNTFMLREYHDHQRDYRTALLEHASTDEEQNTAAAYPIRIRQLVLPEINRVDRCVSCHVGIEDPRMAEMPQPLTTHPGNYLEDHDTGKIGCTVCHDGQGRALTVREAHAVDIEGWEIPLLKQPFIQSNCMRCHDVERLAGLDVVQQGRDLFLNKGCLGCHKLGDTGGQIASDLTHIGDASPRLKQAAALDFANPALHENENLAYIFESVKNPSAQPSVTAMMDYQFTDDEALALTVYLKGLCRRGIPGAYLVKRSASQRTETGGGKALYSKYCIACHGEAGQGGIENRNYAKGTVPALNTLAEKMFLEYEEDAEYVAELLEAGEDIVKLTPPLDVEGRPRVLAQYKAVSDVIRNGNPAGRANPEGPDPLLHMPSWVTGLTNENIDNIIAYLLREYPWEDEEFEE